MFTRTRDEQSCEQIVSKHPCSIDVTAFFEYYSPEMKHKSNKVFYKQSNNGKSQIRIPENKKSYFQRIEAECSVDRQHAQLQSFSSRWTSGNFTLGNEKNDLNMGQTPENDVNSSQPEEQKSVRRANSTIWTFG